MNAIPPITSGQIETSLPESADLSDSGTTFDELLLQLLPPPTPIDVQPTASTTAQSHESPPKPEAPLEGRGSERIPELPTILPPVEPEAVRPTAKAKSFRDPEAKLSKTADPIPLAFVAFTFAPQAAPEPSPSRSEEAVTPAKSTVTAKFHKPIRELCPAPGPVYFFEKLAQPEVNESEQRPVCVEEGEPVLTTHPPVTPRPDIHSDSSESISGAHLELISIEVKEPYVRSPAPVPEHIVKTSSTPVTPRPDIHFDSSESISDANLEIRSIDVKDPFVSSHAPSAPQHTLKAPSALDAPDAPDVGATQNLPARHDINSNGTEFKQPPVAAQEAGNLLVQPPHHEAKSVTIGGPLLNFGNQQNPPQSFDRQPKTSTRSAYHAIVFASAEPPKTPPSEFVSTTPIERPQPPEIPVLPTLQVARRISIEVGDDDSRVRITLHERSGDVSVKFDTATNELRSDLQSSAERLIEAFRREDVPLADLAFTNALGNPDSSGQHERRQNARAFRRQPAVEEFAISEIEVNQSGNCINIHA